MAINIEVSDASQRAIELIKAAGGSVTCVFRTRLKLREHLKPEKFPLPLEEPLPASRIVKKYEMIRERGNKKNSFNFFSFFAIWFFLLNLII